MAKVPNTSKNGVSKHSIEGVSSFSQEDKSVQSCALLSVFMWYMCSFWEKCKNNVLVVCGFFFKPFFPVIRWEFIPLKLTCGRTQQAGDSPGMTAILPFIATGPGETAAGTRVSWTVCVCVHVLVLSFLQLQLPELWGWCCIAVALFAGKRKRKKKEGKFLSAVVDETEKGKPRVQTWEVKVAQVGMANPPREGFSEWPEAGFAAAGSGPAAQSQEAAGVGRRWWGWFVCLLHPLMQSYNSRSKQSAGAVGTGVYFPSATHAQQKHLLPEKISACWLPSNST